MAETARKDGRSSSGAAVFEHLTVEAFRGFNVPVHFDLDASVVLVQGPNGLGKTSLFDAMQWLLLGDVPRLRALRLKPSDEYLVNEYRRGDRARVSASVRINESRVTLTRVGDRSASLLTWSEADGTEYRDDDAQRRLASAFSVSTDMPLEDSLTACGLLQQDAARLVLQAAPKDRYAVFSQLLGLADLADFETWCQSRDKEAAAALNAADGELGRIEQRLTGLTARVATVRETARERPGVADVTARLMESAAAHGFTFRPPDGREEAATVVAAASVLAHEAAQVELELSRLRVQAQDWASDAHGGSELGEDAERVEADLRERAEVAARALETAGAALESARAEVRRLEEAQASLSRMASAVLPHLTGPQCPVCGQSVDEEALRAHLQSLDGALSSVEARQRLSAAEAALAEARQSAVTAASERDNFSNLRLRRQMWDADASRVAERLNALRDGQGPVVPAPPVPGEASPERWLRQVAEGATVVAARAREVVAAFDASASVEEVRIDKDRQVVDQQAVTLRAQRARLAQARNEAATLARAVRDARVEVVRQEFNRISPIAQDVYSRLDPHPTFLDIDLIPTVFRAAGTASATVRDPVVDISADPMLVFSSAQANIAAISFVIALNWVAASHAPVLMLDDPLQAMDDVNVLGFADLCRHLRTSRQLIVSTHERRFAQLLERKLAPRRPGERTLAVEFVGWDRTGPTIKPRDVPDQVDQLGPLLATD